jgi:hypothetical protein
VELCNQNLDPSLAAHQTRAILAFSFVRATAAERLNEGSVRAETAYVRTVRRRFGSDEVEEGGGCD